MTDDAAVAAAFAHIGQIDHLLVTATPPDLPDDEWLCHWLDIGSDGR
jgi:hypothetical protein